MWKKERLLLYFFNCFFSIEELQLAFRDDMESALPLNEENCWIAVGEESLEEQGNEFQKTRCSKTGEQVPSLWLCYANCLCLICNVEKIVSIQFLFPLVD